MLNPAINELLGVANWVALAACNAPSSITKVSPVYGSTNASLEVIVPFFSQWRYKLVPAVIESGSEKLEKYNPSVIFTTPEVTSVSTYPKTIYVAEISSTATLASKPEFMLVLSWKAVKVLTWL